MSEKFNRLWEESKALHRSNAKACSNKFRKDLRKTWCLLRYPFFYWILLRLCFSAKFRHQFFAMRDVVRAKFSKIVKGFIPKIQAALIQQQEGFDQWEEENSGPGRMGTEVARLKENGGRHDARTLSAEMLEQICAISQCEWYFHLPEDPSGMVENPYPGFMTTERAQNYCTYLLQAFS